MESFVISVSLGTGCYRHIQISADATLYRLHQVILSAFGFDDGCEHVFFMDNRLWSPVDVYFSSAMRDKRKLTKKYTLKELKLEKDKKFKYVFDLEDAWVFQCRVLRELEEKTDLPRVIRTVGLAPEQYPEWDEYDMDEEGDIPNLLTREEIDNLYDQIPLSRKEIDRIHGYMSAAANLYGLITLDELYALYNSQNPEVDPHLFLAAAAVIGFEENNDFAVIKTREVSRETIEGALKNSEIVSDYLFVEDPEHDIRELRSAQKGKPLKVLPRVEFLRFTDGGYFPETPHRRAMVKYLRRFASLLPLSPEEYCSCIQSVIVIDASLQEIINLLERDGLLQDKHWDLEQFAALYQELNNNTHKHANRGNTPWEIFEFYDQSKRRAGEAVTP